MRIGIISDSHDHFANIGKAVAVFRERDVDIVIHAGDFISPRSLTMFGDMELHAILGNNEGNIVGLHQKVFSHPKRTLHGHFAELSYEGISIAVYHGTVVQLRDALIESGKYDIVIYGHDHTKRSEQVGATLAINPGAVCGLSDGEPIQATVAILELPGKKVEFVEL